MRLIAGKYGINESAVQGRLSENKLFTAKKYRIKYFRHKMFAIYSMRPAYGWGGGGGVPDDFFFLLSVWSPCYHTWIVAYLAFNKGGVLNDLSAKHARKFGSHAHFC